MDRPKITTFGVPGTSGGCASSFSVDGHEVLVSGGSTDSALRLANELADSTTALSDARDSAEALAHDLSVINGELRATKALLPPAEPQMLMGTGYARQLPDGVLWLLGTRETGWAAFGYRVGDWDNLFRRFGVRVTGHGADEHGEYWTVENARTP